MLPPWEVKEVSFDKGQMAAKAFISKSISKEEESLSTSTTL